MKFASRPDSLMWVSVRYRIPWASQPSAGEQSHWGVFAFSEHLDLIRRHPLDPVREGNLQVRRGPPRTFAAEERPDSTGIGDKPQTIARLHRDGDVTNVGEEPAARTRAETYALAPASCRYYYRTHEANPT